MRKEGNKSVKVPEGYFQVKPTIIPKPAKVDEISKPVIPKPAAEEIKVDIKKNHTANLICFCKYIAIYLKRYEYYSAFGVMRRWRINTLKLRSLIKGSSNSATFNVHTIQLNTVLI